MNILKFLSISVFICLATMLQAQPGNGLGQLELSVTDEYKAQVGEAVKYTDLPQFEDTTTGKLDVNYRISSQPIEVFYKPEPISHARIAKVPVDELYKGMLKAGFGLYGTPILEAYWNSGRSSKNSYGFWGRHFSTHSGVKETVYDDNGLSNNELGAYFNRFYKDFTWNVQAFGKWDKYSYYGIDRYADSIAVEEDSQKPDPEENWFRQYDFKTSIKGKDQKDLGILDELTFHYYNFSDEYKANENFTDIRSNWGIPAGDLILDLDLNITYFQTVFDSLLMGSQSHFTVQARPKISLVLNKIIFDFGINVYSNSPTTDFSNNAYILPFFPEVNIQFPFVEDVLSIYGGIKGRMQHNTYRHLTLQNPYVSPGVLLKPTRTTDIYLGLEGILSSTTSFNIQGGLLNQNDLVLYYRDPFYRANVPWSDSSRFNTLDVIYDNSETFYANGELTMNVNNNLQLGLFGELRAYNTTNEEEAWHLPSFIAGLSADYTIREKIKLSTSLNYVGRREAFEQELNPQVESTLPAYMDANLEVEYLYNSRISAFVNVMNIANSKYDMYLGYKAQSINFLMGFNYKF